MANKITPEQMSKMRLAPLTGKEAGLGYKNLDYKAPAKKKSFFKDYIENVGSGISRAAKGVLHGATDATAALVTGQPITATESGKVLYRAIHHGQEPKLGKNVIQINRGFKTGGKVPEDGTYKLHRGEYVVTAKRYQNMKNGKKMMMSSDGYMMMK